MTCCICARGCGTCARGGKRWKKGKRKKRKKGQARIKNNFYSVQSFETTRIEFVF
jgi:hypothetical protein